jgi:Fe-S-cluster-containing dehydrogenase component/CRP-like cAMP-binding protein
MSHLREVPLLRQLPEARLSRVAAAVQLRSFGSHEWQDQYSTLRHASLEQQLAREPLVCGEGRVPTELVLIRQGFARVSRQQGDTHLTTTYLGKGQLFGLEELAYNTLRSAGAAPRPLQHSLRAVGILDVVMIPAEVFAEEMLPHIRRSDLPASIGAMLLQSLQEREFDEAESTRNSKIARPISPGNHERLQSEEPGVLTVELLQFLIQHRVNNGRQAMVIDLKTCTECNKCVAACEAAHDGNARFDRTGVTHGPLLFTQACMHCADPICMIGCPTGAMTRDEATGTVIIDEPLCIGCGICASNCPYDSLRMVTIHNEYGEAYRNEKSGEPLRKATKCDSCSRISAGPACVRSCPSEAIVRIDLTTPQPLEQWLHTRVG